MPDKAIAVPFSSEEIIEIAVQEFRNRLRGLSPLQGNKEYAAFDVSFNHIVRLYRLGSAGGGVKETLAWATIKKGEQTGESEETVIPKDDYKSGEDVNSVRIEHDLPLTVEANDGKGGKHRKQVKVEKASSKKKVAVNA